MKDKICKNCGKWSRFDWKCCGMWFDPNGRNKCSHERKDNGAALVAYTDESFKCHIETGPNFGCIMFELRTEPEYSGERIEPSETKKVDWDKFKR